MNRLRVLLSALVLTTGSGPLRAAQDAGLPGEFLNFGVGARPLAMGRAFTAVSDDIDALYWNPAGLATYRSSQVEFQHSPLPVEGAFQYIAYSQPLYALGNFGIGIVNLDAGDVPRVDDQNIEIGSFDGRETGYLASYAYQVRDKLALGSTLKMAEIDIAGRSKRGFGADVGALYLMNERVRFGAMVRNLLPPSYDFSTDKDEFPVIARAGTAVKFFNQHLTTAVDLEKTLGTSQGLKWHFGMEGFVIDNIFLRAGVDQTEFTAGAGLKWRNVQFDYGGGFQDLGFINRFSFKVFFGGYEVDVKATPKIFSPVGLKNKVLFKVHTAHRERIVRWIMSVRNAKNEVVRSFQGYEAPPSIIEWDGRDAQGEVVEPGRYTFRMVVTDSRNATEKTPERSIRVVAPSPFEIEAR